MEIDVTLCDKSEAVVNAWRDRFIKSPEVEVVPGDILALERDAVVVPGNSFGFLNQGLELQASELFGFELQDLIRKNIRENYSGELLVGEGFVIPCADLQAEGATCKYLVYVSASRTPRDIDGTLNAYLATRGAFLAISRASSEEIGSIALPGIGTGSSGLHPEICARQMRYAYNIFCGRKGYGDKNLSRLTRRENKLQRMPKPPQEETPGDAPVDESSE